MRRFLLLVVVLVLAAACGKKGGEEQAKQTGTEPVAKTTGPGGEPLRGEPKSMIREDEFSEFETIANARIQPYFDAEGTRTELSVSPGERFTLYVFGEYNELYPMSAAEYRLMLPADVTVLSSRNTDSTIVTLGNWDQDFMIAFRCMPGPKALIAAYECMAGESFTGGGVETVKGSDLNFIGFTMCDEERTLIRAKGGKAELGKK